MDGLEVKVANVVAHDNCETCFTDVLNVAILNCIFSNKNFTYIFTCLTLNFNFVFPCIIV